MKIFIYQKNKDDKIIITEVGKKSYGALQVLSEGNLRALAISILFSKVITDNLSFIICDDINNALDGDFKKGLVELLGENKDFTDLQKIISTHSHDFSDKLCRYKNHNKFILKNENQIFVSQENGNAIIIAEKEYDTGKFHLSLYNCRYELEGLIQRFVDKYGRGVKVKKIEMDGGCRIDLFTKYTISQKICKLLLNEKDDKNISQIQFILLEISTSDTYNILNKGGHNQEFKDDENYERYSVDNSIKLIKQLSVLILN